MIDNWKKVYILPEGLGFIPDRYHSVFGNTQDGDGSRTNPYPQNSMIGIGNNVLGNGLFIIKNSGTANKAIVGHGKYSTAINARVSQLCNNLKDLTILKNEANTLGLGAVSYGLGFTVYLDNIIFKQNISIVSSFASYRNCLFLSKFPFEPRFSASAPPFNNTFIDQSFASSLNTLLNINCSVLHKCEISISSALPAKYSAFSNCTFKIGKEDSFTPLSGNTAKEKKADYISRCATQSIATTNIENFYVFSDNSLDDLYRVIKNSEIDLFGIEKGIYFGYEQPQSGGIPIREVITPNSFNNKEGVSKGVNVSNNLLTIADNANIANGVTKQSTLLVFDSIRSIDSLDLEYSLPDSVIASTTRNLKKIDITTEKIVMDTNYLVSSKDVNKATVQYNDVTYSSNKAANLYIFRGTDTADTIQSASDNAIIYKVLDYVNTPSIGVRTTNQASRLDVKSGDIKNGYWYYIEKGSINYNGNVYPERSSFLATSTKTFTDLGNAVVHEIYIDDETQNPFVDMSITKPVAAMTNFSKVALGSDGKPVGSAHEEFEMMLNKGYMEASPQGRIIQLKVGITPNIG